MSLITLILTRFDRRQIMHTDARSHIQTTGVKVTVLIEAEDCYLRFYSICSHSVCSAEFLVQPHYTLTSTVTNRTAKVYCHRTSLKLSISPGLSCIQHEDTTHVLTKWVCYFFSKYKFSVL